MIARTKIILIGLAGAAVAVGLAATAKASPKVPSGPASEAPGGPIPWMKYSPDTLQLQKNYNAWAVVHGFPTIVEDGILGPNSCTAFTNWWQNGGPEVPAACVNAAISQTCKDAASLRVEYFEIEARITRGEAFSGDEEHLQDLYNEIAKLEALCGDIVLTGTGTRQ